MGVVLVFKVQIGPKIEKLIAARGTYHLNNLVHKIWYQSAHTYDTNKHLGASTPINATFSV